MNYSRLHTLQIENEALPVELPWREALSIYLKRLLIFLIVVLTNILIFVLVIVDEGVNLVPK